MKVVCSKLFIVLVASVGVQGFLPPQTRLVVRPSCSSSPKMLAAAVATTTTSSSDSFIGSTLTDMQLAYEAADKFFDSTEGVEFKQTSGGVNNVRRGVRSNKPMEEIMPALTCTTHYFRLGCT